VAEVGPQDNCAQVDQQACAVAQHERGAVDLKAAAAGHELKQGPGLAPGPRWQR
jgi:hypothetical protein